MDFKTTLIESLNSMWVNVTNFLPKVIGALILFVIIYLIAKTLRKVIGTSLDKLGFNQLIDRLNLTQSLHQAGIKAPPSQLVAKIVFFLVMLGALIVCADVLQMEKVSKAIESFINYIPNIFGAAFILFLAQMAGMFIRETVEATAEHLNFDYGKAIGGALYALIFIIGIVLAFEQLQIETTLLSNVIQIGLIAAGVSLAISLGLGTKSVSNKIVSGVYVREDFEQGDEITLNGVTGVITSVGSVNTHIKKADGSIVIIPNNILIESVVECKKG